ncbi:MAG: PAS domain-containing protein [Rhodothermaceae bacterium]|nr:PAS domain-containing protein [Rhodothermaceae bacterium]
MHDWAVDSEADQMERVCPPGKVQALISWGFSAAQFQLAIHRGTIAGFRAALGTIGKALQVDRIYMSRFASFRTWVKQCQIETICEWRSSRFRDVGRLSKDPYILYRYYPFWHALLESGHIIGGHSYPIKREVFEEYFEAGIKSLLLVPILVGEQYWGILGLESIQSSIGHTFQSEQEIRKFSMELGRIIEKSDSIMTESDTEPISVPKSEIDRFGLESSILSQVSEAIVAIDQSGTVQYFNKSAEVIFGLRRDEVLGQPLSTLTRNRTIEFEKDHVIRAILKDKGAWSGRDRLTLKDWRTREVNMSVTSLMNEGEEQGFIAVYRDVLRDVTVNRQQELRIEHRLRVESALVEASQKLVSDALIDFEQLLGLMGEAVGAESVYFVEIPADKHLLQEVPFKEAANTLPRVWKRDSPVTDENIFIDLGPGVDSTAQRLVCKWNGKKLSRTLASKEQTALAVPVLSPQGRLHGYLGVEYGGRPTEWQEADSRVLSVLGDLLSTYFERRISEEALRKSEERYRTFVDTTSEAIWRIELAHGVAITDDSRVQVNDIAKRGVFAECNTVMAVLLGRKVPEELEGNSIGEAMPHLEVALIEQFVSSGYRLLNYEYSVACAGKENRYFVINAVGTKEDGHLVRIWGSCVEVTERIRLEQQMVETLEDQQQRIGRDLHDGVGQLLTGVRMLSQNLAGKLPDSDENYSHAKKISSFAEQASTRVREIYRGLTPTQLFYEGLSTALNELAHNTNALPGISCEYRWGEKIDVWERETKMHLYRIAQEATNNALKHAEATEIIISLALEGDTVKVRVEDNGKGFDTTIRTGKSLGLNSMEYRSRTIKGQFEITSDVRNGTTVQCTIRDNHVRQELTQIVH